MLGHLDVTQRRCAVPANPAGRLTEREARITDLTGDDARRPVLVATDCLSEGVNLQGSFQAVVHYDLARNPTRHEQREGRVDRFGQRARTVRAVTCGPRVFRPVSISLGRPGSRSGDNLGLSHEVCPPAA